MQALILAAGMGSRLHKYTSEVPKCLVEVNGQTLLDRTIEALRVAGVTKLVIVTGYKAEVLEEHIKSHVVDMDVKFINNEDYSTTNNIYSLYLARDVLVADDTILLESDLIFEKDLLRQITLTPYDAVAAVAKYEPWMDGTVTTLDESGWITAFVEKKDFDANSSDSYYKTVNIYKFSKGFSEDKLVPFLNAFIRAYGKNEYYELVLKLIAETSSSEIRSFIVDGDWYEIDNPQDLDVASVMFSPNKDKLSLMNRRYGGYWRFPGLIDFCYLVNPYFPPASMLDQFNQYFPALLTQYPSGMSVQAFAAANVFQVEEDEIVVGNGAAELINSLKSIVSGKVSLPIPAFNEYIRCFPHCEIMQIDSSISGYRLEVDSILNAAKESDWLILANPDNPSGAFLEKGELFQILDYCKTHDKYVVVDESFMDFAQKDKRFTCIDSTTLHRYPNLIVIKSISKSYGVPGLRLGVLATANKDIISWIRQSLSVWNINSFGEFFLQIAPRYERIFEDACDRIVREREWVFRELSKLGWLEPYESQANYIMCRITEGMTATALAQKLVNDYGLYIKDLTGKLGFNDERHFRIAVRDRADNETLIRALRQIG